MSSLAILTWRMSLKGFETKLESEETGGVVDCFGGEFMEVFSKLDESGSGVMPSLSLY